MEKPRMFRNSQLRIVVCALILLFIGLLVVRYTAALDAGIDHATALRTYTFWAAVCVPVAVLGDILMRTARKYEPVRVVANRVRNRR